VIKVVDEELQWLLLPLLVRTMLLPLKSLPSEEEKKSFFSVACC